MTDYDDHYQQRIHHHLLRHFPATSPLLHEGVRDPFYEARVRVHSGEYFAAFAMTLENLSTDPYIDLETLKYILLKFSDELLYLQDAYKIIKR